MVKRVRKLDRQNTAVDPSQHSSDGKKNNNQRLGLQVFRCNWRWPSLVAFLLPWSGFAEGTPKVMIELEKSPI